MQPCALRRPRICSSVITRRTACLQAIKPRHHDLSTSIANQNVGTPEQTQLSTSTAGSVSVRDESRRTESRHLFRNLLRECTYLPDSQARTWMKEYILQRFQTYNFKVWHHRNDPDYEDRVRRKLREARQAVGLLKRANEGERKPLLKVLLMAYGRMGRRRRELLRPLLAAAPADDDRGELDRSSTHDDVGQPRAMDDPENLYSSRKSSSKAPSAAEVNRGAWTAYVPDLTPQMRALLQSQLQTPPPHLTRGVLRRTQPRLEELNAWLRPMPLKRVKNQTKEWYADLLEKVHPPLPKPEWERLGDLASGERSEDVPVRRQAAARQSSSALETIVMFGKPNVKRAIANRDAHRITPRYMQRLWAQVFAQCPLMEYDAASKQWKVTWGEQALHRSSASLKEGGRLPRHAVRMTDLNAEEAISVD